MTLSRLITSAFYIGKCPLAPGSLASLATCGIILFASINSYQTGFLTALTLFLISSIATLIFSQDAITHTKEKDPSEIVSDEVAGQALAMLALPFDATFTINAGQALIAFALFRIFDIAKPPPVSTCERLGGSLGILADDLIAGIMTGIILLLIAPSLGWA